MQVHRDTGTRLHSSAPINRSADRKTAHQGETGDHEQAPDRRSRRCGGADAHLRGHGLRGPFATVRRPPRGIIRSNGGLLGRPYGLDATRSATARATEIDPWVADADYAVVIVKAAGQNVGDFASTIFEDVSDGRDGRADTNGNSRTTRAARMATEHQPQHRCEADDHDDDRTETTTTEKTTTTEETTDRDDDHRETTTETTDHGDDGTETTDETTDETTARRRRLRVPSRSSPRRDRHDRPADQLELRLDRPAPGPRRHPRRRPGGGPGRGPQPPLSTRPGARSATRAGPALSRSRTDPVGSPAGSFAVSGAVRGRSVGDDADTGSRRGTRSRTGR